MRKDSSRCCDKGCAGKHSNAKPQRKLHKMLIRRAPLPIPLLIFSAAFAAAGDVSLDNQQLSVTVHERDGSYQIAEKDNATPVLRSIIGARVDHRWLKSSQYPKHE